MSVLVRFYISLFITFDIKLHLNLPEQMTYSTASQHVLNRKIKQNTSNEFCSRHLHAGVYCLHNIMSNYLTPVHRG